MTVSALMSKPTPVEGRHGGAFDPLKTKSSCGASFAGVAVDAQPEETLAEG